jgi:hypothetical protein
VSSAYRELVGPNTPWLDVAWRRRVGQAALWSAMSVAAWVLSAALVAASVTPALIAIELTAAVATAAGVWMLASVPSGTRHDWRAWAARATVSATALACLACWRWGVGLQALRVIAQTLLAVAGLFAAARLFNTAKRRPRAAEALTLALCWIIVGVLECTPVTATVAAWLSPWFALDTVFLLWRLHNVMQVVDHAWWFDAAGDAPGEWVALLVHSNERAEALSVDGPFAHFASRDEGAEWLEHNGYVPAERAVAQELVSRVPAELVAPRGARRPLKRGR